MATAPAVGDHIADFQAAAAEAPFVSDTDIRTDRNPPEVVVTTSTERIPDGLHDVLDKHQASITDATYTGAGLRICVAPPVGWRGAGERTVRDAGNSLLLSIPPEAVSAAGITEDDSMHVFATAGTLVYQRRLDEGALPSTAKREGFSWAAVVAEKAKYVDWLTPGQRADWVACVVGGATHAERAEQRDVSEEAVRTRVATADDRLSELAAEAA